MRLLSSICRAAEAFRRIGSDLVAVRRPYAGVNVGVAPASDRINPFVGLSVRF
jgi:hypothetical protein